MLHSRALLDLCINILRTSKSNSLLLFPVSEAGDLLKDKIILENDDPPSPAPFVPTTYSGPKEMNMKSYSSPVKEVIKAENSSNFAFDDLEPLPSTAIPPTPPPVIKVWFRYHTRFFVRVGHEITYEDIGNHNFFTIPCRRQNYQNY